MDTTTITLHPQDVDVLLNGRVVGVVEATARSLGEQFGINVVQFAVTDEGVEVELGTDEVIAVGFAAELRRNTNAWYEAKYGAGALWRTPGPFGGSPD